MAKIVFTGVGLFAFYTLLARSGASPEAALWLTGAAGCAVLVCYGLARA
jgi:hypothetical protein